MYSSGSRICLRSNVLQGPALFSLKDPSKQLSQAKDNPVGMSPPVALLSLLQLLECSNHGKISHSWDVPVVSIPELVGLGRFWHGEVGPCSSNGSLFSSCLGVVLFTLGGTNQALYCEE